MASQTRRGTHSPYCTLHDLRRSFSTLAQRVGLDRATVKDLGGGSTTGVVEKYYTGDISKTHRRAVAFLDSCDHVVAPFGESGNGRKSRNSCA